MKNKMENYNILSIGGILFLIVCFVLVGIAGYDSYSYTSAQKSLCKEYNLTPLVSNYKQCIDDNNQLYELVKVKGGEFRLTKVVVVKE